MHWAYSIDLRERIVAAIHMPGATYNSVAEQFSVGRATVSRLLRRVRETGSVAPAAKKGRPPRVLSEADRAVLVSLVTESPDATLTELADDLEVAIGKRVGTSTVGRALADEGFTRKKKRLKPRSATKSASQNSGLASKNG